MKSLLLGIISTLACIAGFSQKQFEGIVVYRLHSNEGEKEDAKMTIHFGRNAMKMIFEEEHKPSESYMIVRPDSAKMYVVNVNMKTFETKPLSEKQIIEKGPALRKIAGYSTTAVDVPGGNSFAELFGGFVRISTVIMHVADSLFYSVPEKYASSPVFVFIRNNKIALGADVWLTENYEMFDPKFKKDDKLLVINAEAISVKWQAFNEDEFLVPADYRKSDDLTSSTSVDSTISIESIRQESSVIEPPPPPPPKPKPPVKRKPTTTPTQSKPLRKSE